MSHPGHAQEHCFKDLGLILKELSKNLASKPGTTKQRLKSFPLNPMYWPTAKPAQRISASIFRLHNICLKALAQRLNKQFTAPSKDEACYMNIYVFASSKASSAPHTLPGQSPKYHADDLGASTFRFVSILGSLFPSQKPSKFRLQNRPRNAPKSLKMISERFCQILIIWGIPFGIIFLYTS